MPPKIKEVNFHNDFHHRNRYLPLPFVICHCQCQFVCQCHKLSLSLSLSLFIVYCLQTGEGVSLHLPTKDRVFFPTQIHKRNPIYFSLSLFPLHFFYVSISINIQIQSLSWLWNGKKLMKRKSTRSWVLEWRLKLKWWQSKTLMSTWKQWMQWRWEVMLWNKFMVICKRRKWISFSFSFSSFTSASLSFPSNVSFWDKKEREEGNLEGCIRKLGNSPIPDLIFEARVQFFGKGSRRELFACHIIIGSIYLVLSLPLFHFLTIKF